MKYRLEFDPARTGAPRWEYHGDFPTRKEAQEAERSLRRRFGPSTRTRVSPVADDAAVPRTARPDEG
jgi:hypothetical protein